METTFTPVQVDETVLGKRHIEEGEKDPILWAEACKLAKWAHYDSVMVAEALLDRDLNPGEISVVKHTLANSKYDYLAEKEANVDPY